MPLLKPHGKIGNLLVASIVAAGLALSSVAHGAEAKRAKPSLRFVSVSGFRISVAGSSWGKQTRIAFAVRSQGMVEGLIVRATNQGSFVVGVRNIDLCGGSNFVARDFSGHKVQKRGPALMCPTRQNPPRPILKVIKGSVVRVVRAGPGVKRSKAVTVETRMISVNRPSSLTVHIGDSIYLWEPGLQRPFFSPGWNDTYLALIRQGRTPARMCPEVDCDAGFFWEWVAVKAGKTGISLSPSCRLTKPPCEIASFIIRITIV